MARGICLEGFHQYPITSFTPSFLDPSVGLVKRLLRNSVLDSKKTRLFIVPDPEYVV